MDGLGGANGERALMRADAAEESLREFRYAACEEALRVYKSTRPQHAWAYRELAKGPGAPAAGPSGSTTKGV